VAQPTLLLTPNASRDRNGAVSLTYNGDVRVVQGQYGPAWSLESATTNVLPNSHAATSDTGWGNINSGVTRTWDNSVGHAYGTSVRYELSGDMGIQGGTLYTNALTVNEGEQWTGSMWVRTDVAGPVRILVREDASGAYTGKTYEVEANTWTRLDVQHTIVNGSASRLHVRVDRTNIASTMWLTEAQLEQHPFATSYTEGSREAAYINATHLLDRVNPHRGTILVRFRKTVNSTSNNYILWLGGHNIAGEDWTSLNTMGMNFYIAWRSGQEPTRANSPRPPLTLNQWHTGAHRWYDTSFDYRLDTSEWVTNSRDPIQGAFRNRMWLSYGSLPMNGELEAIAFFDDVLTDDEVQRLMDMPTSWTWENIQPPQVVTPRVRTGSMQLIPRVYKATRHNTLGEDITHAFTKGKVEFNPDRTIKWSLSLDTSEPDVVQPYVDFVAPFMTVVYDDGTEETSQMGLFNVVPPSQTITEETRTATLAGNDLTWLLASDVFENGYTVEKGTNVVAAVETVIRSVGLTRIVIAPTDKTLASTTSWKPATTKLEVINDLLNAIGYYTLYMTKDGMLASKPYQSAKTPNVSVVYDTTDPYSRVMVHGAVKKDTTPDRIANKVVVVKDNANEDPIVAVAINSNPLSPTSTVSLGITIAKTYTESNFVDEEAAQVMAQRRLEEASQVYNKLTLTTTVDVNREPHEVYQLNIHDPVDGGVVVDGIWNCRGWTIGFTPSDGQMTHELSNIDHPPMDM